MFSGAYIIFEDEVGCWEVVAVISTGTSSGMTMEVMLWDGGFLCGGMFLGCGCSCYVHVVIISYRCECSYILFGMIILQLLLALSAVAVVLRILLWGFLHLTLHVLVYLKWC